MTLLKVVIQDLQVQIKELKDQRVMLDQKDFKDHEELLVLHLRVRLGHRDQQVLTRNKVQVVYQQIKVIKV